MTRQVSKTLKAYLATRESARLDVHDDGFGFATVGVGHKVLDRDKLRIGDTITTERMYQLLDEDLEWACEAVERYVRAYLYQREFDALVCFCFNIGQAAFAGSTLVRRLNELADTPGLRNPMELRDRVACTIVREELPRWKRVGSNPDVVGLYNRRIDTAQMFCEGDYSVDWSGLEDQR